MERAAYAVTHMTNEMPSGLKPAEEIAPGCGLSAERLLELANAYYVPHYRIDGNSPLFRASEVKQWIAGNLMVRCEGRPIADSLKIVVPAPPVFERPPPCIAHLPALQQLPRHDYQPGVYFLCKGDAVVYVGQSVCPTSRIGQHAKDKEKDFDRVYMLPVPKSELNDVEAAFIHHLKPCQQGGIKAGKERPVSPSMSLPIDEILRRAGALTSYE